MHLYRGIKEPYKPSRVGPETNFTDCPYTALQYAHGRRGVVLMIDKPGDFDVVQADWLKADANRFLVYGPFDQLLVAAIEAKVLRATLKRMGMSKLSIRDNERSWTLRREIRFMLNERHPFAERLGASGGSELRGSR